MRRTVPPSAEKIQSGDRQGCSVSGWWMDPSEDVGSELGRLGAPADQFSGRSRKEFDTLVGPGARSAAPTERQAWLAPTYDLGVTQNGFRPTARAEPGRVSCGSEVPQARGAKSCRSCRSCSRSGDCQARLAQKTDPLKALGDRRGSSAACRDARRPRVAVRRGWDGEDDPAADRRPDLRRRTARSGLRRILLRPFASLTTLNLVVLFLDAI